MALKEFFDANQSDALGVSRYLNANGYTKDSAAAEMGVDTGTVDSYFGKFGVDPWGANPTAVANQGQYNQTQNAWGAAPAAAPAPAAPAPASPFAVGGSASGASAPTSQPRTSQLGALNWNDPTSATKDAWGIMQKNGWTADQAAADLNNGITGADITAHLAKYGYGGSPSPLGVSTGSGGGFNLSTMSGAPTFGNTPQAGPTPWNVDGNQTVATQLEKILKTDSPLMQLAKTRAQQEAQSRGLLNTTMAGTAGEAAMIDKALPIAQQDARTYGDAGQFNAKEGNTFTLADNQFNRDKSMANFNLSANEWAAGKQFGRSETAADRAYLRQNQTADQNLVREKELARTNADLNRANSAASAAQGDEATLKRGYVNAIDKARSDYATSLKEISASSTMDAGLKTQTLQNLRVTYNTMISNYAKSLGWDANSWLIGDEAPAAVAPPTVTPPATGDEPRY